MFGRSKIVALSGEFLGTAALTVLILSVQRSTIGVPFFVAIAAGLIMTLMLFTVGVRTSGFFNPAITISLWTARRLSTVRSIGYIAAQMLGAWGAYWLYRYYINNPLQPVGGHYTGHILVAEAVGTGLFAFGVAAVVYRRGVTEAAAASFAGLALVLGTIAASPAAIGLLNPAVALGVRAWVWGTYVLGPVVGAIIGFNLYALLFADPKELVAGETASVVSSAVGKKQPVAAASTTTTATKAAPAKKAPAKKKTTRKK